MRFRSPSDVLLSSSSVLTLGVSVGVTSVSVVADATFMIIGVGVTGITGNAIVWVAMESVCKLIEDGNCL